LASIDRARRRNDEVMGRYHTAFGSVDGRTHFPILALRIETRANLMTSATSQLSGGIIFTVYGKVVELAGKI
jgi:hypothetical protein